ncbi:hypothetical protein [Clostridium tertium]|jgi:F0F1-type ATP synthase delta subunit|uniref:hypothetical protein n=1 Tax=Clostridium tertium TaxID=1559 RepID=UPI00291B9289|nr:hypothetical protein [Clostridium sp.]
MDEIFEYLEEISYMNPKVIKIRLKNMFRLSDKQVEKIYSKWKKEFMKCKHKEITKSD